MWGSCLACRCSESCPPLTVYFEWFLLLQHCSDNDNDSRSRALLLVTASLDKMVLKKPIRVDTDMKVVGAVTWVGRSSIEIQMIITQLSPGIYIRTVYSLVFRLIFEYKSILRWIHFANKLKCQLLNIIAATLFGTSDILNIIIKYNKCWCHSSHVSSENQIPNFKADITLDWPIRSWQNIKYKYFY